MTEILGWAVVALACWAAGSIFLAIALSALFVGSDR